MKIIYYNDELNDEFSTAQITPKIIDGNYKYDNNTILGKIRHVFWYKIIAKPAACLFLKIKYHHKIVNGEVLNKTGNQGYYVYGNHTHAIADALIPTMVNIKTDTYVIVHPNNVSMPVLGRITPYLGAIPLPDDIEATKHFTKSVKDKIEKNKCVMIYPEAHIWPYYTKIRPFVHTSFRYPVQTASPVYCITNTYQKRRFTKTPQIVTYVDGPFYSSADKSTREQKQELREQVYQTMVERSKNNNIELIRYEKAGDRQQ